SGCGRPIIKFKEYIVKFVIIRDLFQFSHPKYFFHLAFKGFGEKSVNIMVTIIGKHKSAIPYIFFKVFPFFRGKLHKTMPGNITERTLKNLITAQRNDILLFLYFKGCILHKRIQEI